MTSNRIRAQRLVFRKAELLHLGGCEKRGVDETGADGGYFYAGEGLGVFERFDEADDGVLGRAVKGRGDTARYPSNGGLDNRNLSSIPTHHTSRLHSTHTNKKMNANLQ